MLNIDALSFGPEIEAMRGARGRVLAVMRSAVYIESDEGHVVGIVGPTAPDSPLVLVVPRLEPLVSALSGGEGWEFRAADGVFELGGVARITLRGLQPWEPAFPQFAASFDARITSMLALARHAGERGWHGTGGEVELLLTLWVEAAGLSGEWPAATFTPTALQANATLKRVWERTTALFSEARNGDDAAVGDSLVSLLGLGPGLTPSGDDLVAGALASLAWQARLGLVPLGFVSILAETIRATAPDRTNKISARMLWYAGNGLVYAPAMQLGAALLAGDVAGLQEPARRLFGIGHSTGLDIAVGLLCGLLVGMALERRAAHAVV